MLKSDVPKSPFPHLELFQLVALAQALAELETMVLNFFSFVNDALWLSASVTRLGEIFLFGYFLLQHFS